MPERVIYRDEKAFKEALDKAADSISTSGRPDVVGQVIFWGLIVLLGFLYLGDRVIDWPIRRAIPGVDLVKPVWVLLAGMLIYHHAWSRHQHARILRHRLCFKCGHRLDAEPVDDEGDGACPDCGEAFNLGQYRRPSEQRGSNFRGYLDRDHFDKTMFAAAERLKKLRASGFEVDLMGWAWLALGVGFGLSLLGWDVLDFLPGFVPGYGVVFGILLIWGAWYSGRVKRLRPAIIDKQLCLNCGYSLLGTPVDEDGLGRCPECGQDFVAGQYVKPEEA